MTAHILLAAEVVSALVVLAGVFAMIGKVVHWVRSIVEGFRCHLRSDMVNLYYRHKDTKTLRQYEKENLIKLYAAYKALKGNSFIDDLYEEMMEWEVVT